MYNLELSQIVEIDEHNLDIMTNWIYKWWKKEEYRNKGIVRLLLEKVNEIVKEVEI